LRQAADLSALSTRRPTALMAGYPSRSRAHWRII